MLKKLTLSSLLLACHAVLYPAGALASDLSVGLRIDCGNANDQGVQVFINDEFKGECPVDVNVKPGATKIEGRISRSNGQYDSVVNEQLLAANTMKRIQLGFAGVEIDCGTYNEQSVNVFVNGESRGECPLYAFILPGKVKIEARKDRANGHYDFAVNEQRLAANTNKRIQLELRPFEKPGRIGEFMNNADGTVTDTRTNLTWQRCSVGQRWTGSSCDGEATEFTWAEAMRLGSSGWRLPTVDELATLVVCSSGSRLPSARPGGRLVAETAGSCQGNYTRPTIDLRVFPNTPVTSFWSSSPYAGNSHRAWLVYFYDGGANYLNMNGNRRVRLVRAGQ